MANSDISYTCRHFYSPHLPKEGQFSVCVRSGLSISALVYVAARPIFSINWILDLGPKARYKKKSETVEDF